MTADQKLRHASWLRQSAMRAETKTQRDAEMQEALRLEWEALRELQAENQERADNDN